MSTETDTSTAADYERLAADPHAFDARLAAHYDAWEKASTALQQAWSQIHTAAGDRRDLRGRSGHAWHRTHSEVEQTVRQMAAHQVPLPASMGFRKTPGDLLVALREAEAAVAKDAMIVHRMEAIYDRPENRWQRFFPCGNRDGHIHASYRDCPTVRWDTLMGWRPDLSGKTVDEAVADLGPALCSICFADAPVEQKSMTLGQVADERTRDEREAAKAARQAIKDAKQLTEAEQREMGRDRRGDRVTTVARLKEIVRDAIGLEVEAEYWAGRSPEGWTAEQIANRQAGLAADIARAQQDAGRAASILRAREAEHEGWGAAQAAITKMQQAKYKNARKEWGLA